MRTGFIKAIAFAAAFATLCGLFQGGARAQFLADETASQKPPVTAPVNVAMIYYKYSGQEPDFSVWAALTDEYKNAPDFDKQNTLRLKAAELSQNFGLLVPNEQILVDQAVTLSDYSVSSGGYLLESLKDDMYFTVSYGGEDFALVPSNVMDFQWIAADGMQAKALDDLRAASPGGKQAVMSFVLKARHAGREPVEIDGRKFRVIAVEMQGLSAFDAAGNLAWTLAPSPDAPAAIGAQERDDLLRLYQ